MSGGFENAPSSYEERLISIDFFYGDCQVIIDGKKMPLTKLSSGSGGFLVNNKKSSSWKKFEEPKPTEGLIIKGKAVLITGKNGYISGLSSYFPEDLENKEGRQLMIFPDSEAIINVRTTKRSEKFTNPNGTTGVKLSETDVIDNIELVRGLFHINITTSGDLKEVLIINKKYPSITFMPMMGKFGKIKNVNATIELNPDNSLTIFNTMNSIIHDASGLIGKSFETLRPIAKPKFVITKSNIYITDLAKNPDKRVELIEKRWMELNKYQGFKSLEQGYASATSKETTNQYEADRIKQIKQELTNAECMSKPDPKLIAFLKSQLNIKPTVTVSNELKDSYKKGLNAYKPLMSLIEGALPSYTPVMEADKVVVIDVKRTSKSYDQLIEEHQARGHEITDVLNSLNYNDAQFQSFKRAFSRGEKVPSAVIELIRKEKENRQELESSVKGLASDKGIVAQTASKSVNESLTYNKLKFNFTKIEKGTEINMARAPPGKEYLFIYFDVTNNSKNSEFIFPDEEVRLIVGSEVIPLRNYRMETNMDAGKTYSGEQFFFVVPNTSKEFTLELGKKILPKISVKLKL